MNRIILLLFLTFTASAVSQQTLFIDKNYNETLALAKSEQKPLLIMFYANWCPHCNTMKKEIFTDGAVSDFYSENFLCMSVDTESAYGKELKTKFQNKFRINSFPTFAFLDPNENLLYCTAGEFKKEKFLSEGKDVLVQENQLPYIKNAFLTDTTNPDKCLKYIIAVRKAGFDATLIAQKYLNTVAPESKISEINWKIFSNGINNFDTEEFRYLVQNKEAFAKVSSPARVDKKIAYTISETLRPLVERMDTITYNKKRLAAQSLQIRKVDSLVYRFDIQLLSQTGEWKKYQKITTDNVEKFSWNDTVLLYDICTTYFQNITDKKGLQQAAEWGKRLIALNGTVDRYVVTSKLLMKLKDYKQAMEFAQKGKSFADGLGFKSAELDGLLADIKKQNL
ncbi:thioredoxin family protein [Flavobacterium sp.]